MSNLSPAAQAVLDAASESLAQAPWHVEYLAKDVAAAVIRAAADQAVPVANYSTDTPWGVGFADRDAQLRRDLLAIATELENAS